MGVYTECGGDTSRLVPAQEAVASLNVSGSTSAGGNGALAVDPWLLGWVIRARRLRGVPGAVTPLAGAEIIEHHPERVVISLETEEGRARLDARMIGDDPFFAMAADFVVQAVAAVPFGTDDDLFPPRAADVDGLLNLEEIRTLGRLRHVHLHAKARLRETSCNASIGLWRECTADPSTPVYVGSTDAWCVRCVRGVIADAKAEFEEESREGLPLTPDELRVLLYDPGLLVGTLRLEDVQPKAGNGCFYSYPEGCLSSWPLYVFDGTELCSRCARAEVEGIRQRASKQGIDLEQEMQNATRLDELLSVEEVRALLADQPSQSDR